MKTAEEIANTTAAYVDCKTDLLGMTSACGTVPLTEEQYYRQLSDADSFWRCPKCGQSAEYNDTESERVQGVNDDAADPIALFADIPAPVLDEIGIERERQKVVEGFHESHDDEHDEGELVRAAVAYLLVAKMPGVFGTAADWWPFEDSSFKPGDRRRDLIRAAALIVAEIERIDRKAAREVEKVPT